MFTSSDQEFPFKRSGEEREGGQQPLNALGAQEDDNVANAAGGSGKAGDEASLKRAEELQCLDAAIRGVGEKRQTRGMLEVAGGKLGFLIYRQD